MEEGQGARTDAGTIRPALAVVHEPFGDAVVRKAEGMKPLADALTQSDAPPPPPPPPSAPGNPQTFSPGGPAFHQPRLRDTPTHYIRASPNPRGTRGTITTRMSQTTNSWHRRR